MTKKTSLKSKSSLKFPNNLLEPVGAFLRNRLKKLESRRKSINSEDPFANIDRIGDNASPDTEAAEQFGHARASAIKLELDRKIVQTRKALAKIKIGSYGICEECGKMIDTDRLMIYPEATKCVSCEKKKEK